ncbi:hypothetical protein [Alkalihalobacillus deserti]|uniref:hypothetical protein n=1 Tax=Alkalihalobacillus deserti TaxID=2879466 RepID=UPI001D15B924|nr:hypothetical protein [Alkalihalobacillus deserti]
MFPSSLQGIRSFSPLGFRHGLHQGYGYFWHHPGFYPGYQGNGYEHFESQLVYNHGHEYQWHNKYPPYQEHHEAHSQDKLHVKSNNDYHLHHGYPYGQGSGQFPDYYNHHY